MEEEPIIRFVGAAKQQIRELTKTRFLRRNVGCYIFDEIEEAYRFPEKSSTMEESIQHRPEYLELAADHQERAKNTRYFKGRVCEMHWFEEPIQARKRLMTIWAINTVDRGRPTLIGLWFGD